MIGLDGETTRRLRQLLVAHDQRRSPGVEELALRLQLLLSICTVGWLVFAAQHLAFGDRPRALVLSAVVGLATAALQLVARRLGSVDALRRLSHVHIAVSTLGLTLAAANSGRTESIAIWYLVAVPLFAGYHLGVRAAIAWTFVVIAGALALAASEPFVELPPEFVPDAAELVGGQGFLAVILLGFAVATSLANDHQVRTLARQEDSIRQQNRRLEAEVAHRRDALGALAIFELACAQAIDGIAVAAPDGVLTFANEAWGQLHGIHPALACGTNLEAAFADDDARLARFEDGPFEGELDHIHADGGRFPTWTSITAIRDADGAPIGAIAVARDLTRRKELDRLKHQFVATVSHELRTPLTSLRGSLGLLEHRVAGDVPESVERLLGMAKRNTERLVRLVDDILDLEKLDADGLVLARRPTAAAGLVADAVSSVEESARAADVAIVQEIESATVDADPDRIVQVLVNLLDNAVKFSERGGAVRVTVERVGEQVVFAVHDEGAGIAEADRARIFDPFLQLDGSDERLRGGSGLGLAIARSIVEQHAARIEVEGELGRGSTFLFRLEAAEGPSTEAPD